MDITVFREFIYFFLVGLAAIVGAIARPYFSSLKAKAIDVCHFKGGPSSKVDQIYAWQSPDDHGQQQWRGHGIEQRLDGLKEDHKAVIEKLDKLIELARRQ